MELEASPEPAPEEREALAAALAQLAERERRADLARSVWWRAGVRENVDSAEPY